MIVPFAYLQMVPTGAGRGSGHLNHPGFDPRPTEPHIHNYMYFIGGDTKGQPRGC